MKKISITIFVLFFIALPAVMAQNPGRASGKPIRTSQTRAVAKENDTTGKKDTSLPKPALAVKKDTSSNKPVNTVKKETTNKNPADTSKNATGINSSANALLSNGTNGDWAANAEKKDTIKFDWLPVFKSEPQIRKGFPKFKDAVRNPYTEARLQRSQIFIGRCEKPNVTVRLEIREISVYKIHGNYTEVENNVIVDPDGFSFGGSKNSNAVEMIIDGTNFISVFDFKGLESVSKFDIMKIANKTNLDLTSQDYIVHLATIGNLKALKKNTHIDELKKELQQYYPPVSDSVHYGIRALQTGVTESPFSTDGVLVNETEGKGVADKVPTPKAVSVILNGFGGGAYRIVRVNQALYTGDEFIKTRNETETTIGSWGFNLGLGLNLGKNHVFAAEFFQLNQGFSSSKGVNWSTGNPKTDSAARYELTFNGWGLSYYYMPENFLFQFGLYYTTLKKAEELSSSVNKHALIGRLMLGYSRPLRGFGNFYIAPTINYNFTALSRQELKTKLFAYGITAGLRFTLYKKAS